MEHKAIISPDGCAPEIKTKASTPVEVAAEKQAFSAVTKYVEHVLTSRNEVVTRDVVEKWQAARRAWVEYSKFGLNVAATSVHAVPTSSPDASSPPLLVQSKLEIPKLNMAKYPELVFEDTKLGQVSVGWVYVENPTSSAIVFSLTTSEVDEGVWIQSSPKVTNSWFTGGGWMMTEKSAATPVLLAGYGHTHHNKDAEASRSAHGISLLLRGCGRRCAVKGESTSPTSLFAPIVPTSTENEEGTLYRITKPHMFAISHDAFRQKIVEPFGVARLGPVFFKPWGQGDHAAGIYIQNEISGLEKVTLLGRGITSHITFEDPDLSFFQGWNPNVVNKGGKMMLKFPHGTDYESPSTMKKIRVGNYGGGTVEVDSFYLSSTSKGVERGWDLAKGFGLSSLIQWLPLAFSSYGPGGAKPTELLFSSSPCQSREFEIVDCGLAKSGFILGPEEFIDIEVAHWPTCQEVRGVCESAA